MSIAEPEKKKRRSTASLRRELKNRLNHIGDRRYLRCLLNEVKKKAAHYEEFSDDLKVMIEEGERDIAEGRVVPHEQVVQELSEWFRSH